MITDPFASFVGAVVTDDNFIGRKDMLKALEERASGTGSVNVVGLPRMGKTSLVKKCFLKERLPWWVKEHRRVPVYLSLDTQPTAHGFWGNLAKGLRETFRKLKGSGLLDLTLLKEWTDELKGISLIPLADDRYTEISGTVQRMKDDAGLSPVFILDEFDSIQRYKYPREVLSQLRTLSQDAPIVTVSRRLPESMERTLYGTGYFSNVNTMLFVGLFSEADAAEYWSHFAYAFDSLGENRFRQYRELVDRYVGRHPMLMSFMNHTVLDHEADLLRRWADYRNVQDLHEIERAIRSEVNKQFETQLRYLEEQALKDTAAELVVGGMGDPDWEASDLLLRYQFVHKVTAAEKQELFGYDLGYHEDQFRYVCFSDFTTHLMRDLCDPPVKGYALLKKTEVNLRNLIRRCLEDLFGADAFEQVYDENGYVHEKWEEAFLAHVDAAIDKLPPAVRDEKKERLHQSFDEMLVIWDKRFANDYKSSYASQMDIVSSSTLGQLWHVFIRWFWKDYYAEALAPDKPSHRADPDLWYKDVFEPILRWRNAVNHFHDEEWTEDAVSRSNDCCNAVCRAVTAWIGRKA